MKVVRVTLRKREAIKRACMASPVRDLTGIASCYRGCNNHPPRSTPFLCAPKHIHRGLILMSLQCSPASPQHTPGRSARSGPDPSTTDAA
jgi:hypothetical protein